MKLAVLSLLALPICLLTGPVHAQQVPVAELKRTPKSAVTPEPMTQNGRHPVFLERAKDKTIQLVFLGDSITDCWNRGSVYGQDVWDRYYVKYNAANFGASGEYTEHTLGHIAEGVLDGLKPKVVVVMIGTNNIGHTPADKPAWAAAGVKKIVESVHEKLPDTKVLLLGVFPRDAKNSPTRKAVSAINAIIRKLDDGRKTRYLDLTPKFLDAAGEIPTDVMPDGIHPSAKGFEIWAEAMNPLLTEMMK